MRKTENFIRIEFDGSKHRIAVSVHPKVTDAKFFRKIFWRHHDRKRVARMSVRYAHRSCSDPLFECNVRNIRRQFRLDPDHVGGNIDTDAEIILIHRADKFRQTPRLRICSGQTRLIIRMLHTGVADSRKRIETFGKCSDRSAAKHLMHRIFCDGINQILQIVACGAVNCHAIKPCPNGSVMIRGILYIERRIFMIGMKE